MANQLEKAIKISEAISEIDSNKYLLPSIQRRFVWGTEQIEMLFDSIMQGYPINTMMMWHVTGADIKNNFRFYEFLREFKEYNGGNNPQRSVNASYTDFYAIIDGQQRLNSLYLGLKGSFAYRKHQRYKKKYLEDEHHYPSRVLYLDLLSNLEDDEMRKMYDFRFLIKNEHVKEGEENTKIIELSDGSKITKPCFWFEVGTILTWRDESEVLSFLLKNGLADGVPLENLLKLYSRIRKEDILNYYLEKEQDFDKILHEFVRTNSGGTKLSFADLLMSIITASWDRNGNTKGAREEIDSLVRLVLSIGFSIDYDFILKTCLVIVSSNIRFSLQNFGSLTIIKIGENWGKITQSILEAFKLAKSLSFNDFSLRSKNAIIPVALYLFNTGYYVDINKENKHFSNKKVIRQYLHISLLNKLFSGSADGVLSKLRHIINCCQGDFPLDDFRREFTEPPKSFQIDEDRLKAILRKSYNDLDSFYILALLYPTFDFQFKEANIDHLHPVASFKEESYIGFTNERRDFYDKHYNTVLNLGFLASETNQSKKDQPLKVWIDHKILSNSNIRSELLIPEEVDLCFDNFEQFIMEREQILLGRLKANLS
ncbi:Protein of unknown function DUF262 [Chitinophaga sp. CF118]|uniref:DUF262 domain-containing protein n=1 Tax=Chitinophaga sp. CF118 TaxID=1884367 RepID=UPI0008EB425E|nr:DUF262 domain-containing protein [Chitinophaga sp. CF118]SFE63906.1 Protein of unknown function DUF262 [Chitinophaga sp. CF118]